MPESPNPKLYRPHATGAPVQPSSLAYAELEVATNFSFLRGASHPDELIARAAELGYRAIGVTDLNSLAGAVRMHSAAKQVGLKLVVGVKLTFFDYPSLLVWPTDRTAYAKLCRLLTVGKRRAEKGECELSIQDFIEHADGILAAVIPPESIPPGFGQRLGMLKDVLGGRLSLAATALYESDNQSRLAGLSGLSRSCGVPLLATNDIHYHTSNRRPLQDVLTCIRYGCTIHDAGYRLFQNGERYLKSPEQMHALFADHPQAIRQGIEIAEACSFNLDQLKYEYPDELSPPGCTPLQYLGDLAWIGAAERYPAGVPEKVRTLIERELKLIGQMKIEAYFLTVYDLVKYARSRDILCQGRGSAANSAVCYCIGVTSVDPAKIDVLFERFISAARNEPPDIDIDVEHERREEVIQYLYDKYGRDRAGMTAEVITYRGRSAVRDVGKALGLGLDTVDQMARRLDWWDRGTLTVEKIREIGLDPADRTVQMVVGLTSQMLGFPRHLSQHVGGMVMTRGLLSEMVPIENASMADRTVIEWDKTDIDDLGILKVDVLALGMLTCIAKCLKLINAGRMNGRDAESAEKKTEGSTPFRPLLRYSGGGDARPASIGQWFAGRAEPPPLPFPGVPEEGEKAAAPSSSASLRSLHLRGEPPLQMHSIPAEDPAVYAMISDADTVGVFQIESRAQMTMLPRLKPEKFYDLVIEVAIVRPGPIQGDMVHPYLRRRNKEEPVTYPSPELEAVLSKTLGIPLFQEQAMRVVMVGAGFSAEEADQFRRAMAAWKRGGAMEEFHRKILEGMHRNGYTPEYAEQCFNMLKGFGEYGFPESHSASFALLVYVSAWIKRHHPAIFCCGLLNSQPMGFYAPAQIVRDARDHGVEVRSVDVNSSDWDCTMEERLPLLRDAGGEGRGELLRQATDEVSPSCHPEGVRATEGSGSSVGHAPHDAIPVMRSMTYGIEEPDSSLAALAQNDNVAQGRGSKTEEPPHPGPLPRIPSGEGMKKSTWGYHGPAVRLGFRQVKGFREAYAGKIVEARRRIGRFHSVAHFHRATHLPRTAIQRLAEADAFASMGLSRRQALWQTLALRDEQGLLFEGDWQTEGEREPKVALPQMPIGQEVMTDYRTTSLSLKKHPLALLRPTLLKMNIITAVELSQRNARTWVKVAGLVLIRQRPGTASGVVFETIEDETGVVNLIIRPDLYDRSRHAARHSALLEADGYVERNGQVIHVMAKRLIDLSHLLPGYEMTSRDFH